MRYLTAGLGLTLCAIAAAGRGTEGRPAQVGKCVSIEIVLADAVGPILPAAPNGPAQVEITADRIQELEKQGKLEATVRIRVATLENCEAMVQFGERVPRGTQQTMAAHGSAVTSYSMENVGTQLTVTPRVEDDGQILLDLKVERSRLAGRRSDADTESRAASQFVPSSTLAVSAKASVRIAAGKTVVVEAQQTSSKESRQTWIVATAKVLDHESLSKNQLGDLRSAVSAGSETRAERASWIGSK